MAAKIYTATETTYRTTADNLRDVADIIRNGMPV